MKIIDALKFIERVDNLPLLHNEVCNAVVGFIYSYFEDLVQIERKEQVIQKHNISVDRSERLDSFKYLDDKKDIHKRYWSNSEVFYIPCSSSSELDHDWTRIKNIEVLQTGNDDNPQFFFCSNYQNSKRDSFAKKAFLLRLQNNELKIEHEFYG